MDKNHALNYDYDEKADVLYVSFGEPREAECVELEEGILLRIDMETKELVGYTIVHFRTRFAGKSPSKKIKIPLVLQEAIPEEIWELAVGSSCDSRGLS